MLLDDNMRPVAVQLGVALGLVYAITTVCGLRWVGSTTLGEDPATVNRLNGESFQQDPLVTFNGMFLY